MTFKSDPDARSGRVHRRLTVARASASERAELSGALGGFVVTAADLERSAEEFALERSAHRAAARARLDAAALRVAYDVEMAAGELEHLQAGRQALVDGALWAGQAEAGLARHREVVEAARVALEARQADQRVATMGLDRVLEQRCAAGAAMEDADRQLDGLAGDGMDESGLRRELEASGQAVRAAHEAHAVAVALVQELMGARDSVEQRSAHLREVLGASGSIRLNNDDDFDRVLAAFHGWVKASENAGFDPYAQALADAFADLLADLAELEQQTEPRPDEHALAVAQEMVDRAAVELERLNAVAAPALTAADRLELDAAHKAVEAAEERSDRRVGRSAACKKRDEAREAERLLLDRFGFGSHLDVVLTGGRAVICAPERLAAERTFLAAKADRDGLLKAQRASPALEHLHSERARLRALVMDRIGVDPGDDVIAVLRAHRLVPEQVVDDLRGALANVGVCPVGVALATAAEAWLGDEVASADDNSRASAAASDLAAELDTLVIRSIELADELTTARQGEERAAEQLELASRCVGAVEAELSDRAGEDTTRLQRFVAADQLRTQIEALTATLVRAEDDARSRFNRAAEAARAADVACDRAQDALADLVRRARKLAEELPLERRPVGDPLATLATLAELLAQHALVGQPAIEAAESAVALVTTRFDVAVATAEAAGTGLEGPRLEDVTDGLRRLLEAEGLVVLVEPFLGPAATLRPELLEVLLGRSDSVSLILLTEDTDTLGWAIELPADQAAVVRADSLLNLSAWGADTNSDSAPPNPARLRVGQR